MQKLFFFLLVFACCVNLVFSQSKPNCRKHAVYFGSNKSVLSGKYKTDIDSIVNQLDPERHYIVELHSFTDSISTRSHNEQLGNNRNKVVQDYILSKQHKHLVFLKTNYGEMKYDPLNPMLSRRVDIYTVPLDTLDNITIEGAEGVKAKMSYTNYEGCGFCLQETEKDLSNLWGNSPSKKVLSLEIKSGCGRCSPVEFRIPAALFDVSINKARNRKINLRCMNKLDFGNYAEYLKDTSKMLTVIDSLFQIRFDTLTNEYVCYASCYNYADEICCGTIDTYIQNNLHLPTEIQDIKTVLVSGKDKNRYENMYLIKSHAGFNMLYSYGFRNGEPYFAKCRHDQIRRDRFELPYGEVSRKGATPYDPVILNDSVPLEVYKPLRYSKTTIKLKIPRKLDCKNVGYLFQPYGYFVPMKKVKRNKYKYQMPADMEFDIQVSCNGTETTIPYKDLRKKFKKRRNILKMRAMKVS